MTPTEIRQKVQSLAADHPAKLAFEQSRDVDCADLLSAKTQPGRVPVAELKLYAYDLGLIGKAAVVLGMPVPTDGPGQQFYGACATLTGMLRDLEDVNVQAAAFQQALGAFVLTGWLTQNQADEIVGLAQNRTPLASVIAAEVEAARRGND